MKRHPATFAALLAGIVAAAILGLDSPVASLGWRADSGFESVWRLVTAHFVHLGALHFAVNFFAALLIGWVCDQLHLAGQLASATLACLIGLGIGLEFGPWAIAWYVGLSGLLHGLFAWLCLELVLAGEPARPARLRVLAAVLLVGGLVKVVANLDTPVGAIGWLGIAQAPPAHLYGFLGGTFWAILRRLR